MNSLSRPLLPILSGAERCAAHAAIRAHLDARDDAAAAHVLGQDPSLAVERIPAQEPITGAADDGWSAQSTWYGTWLCKAANLGLVKTVERVLAAGIHPDDTKAFAHMPLIRFPAWAVSAEHLELAYRYGANPDNLGLVIEAGGSLDTVGGSSHLPPVLSCVQRKCAGSAAMLIRRGARTDDAYVAGRTVPALTFDGKGGRTTGTLLEEAFAAGGQVMVAQLTEAMMQRRLGEQRSAALGAEAPRRRQRKV